MRPCLLSIPICLTLATPGLAEPTATQPSGEVVIADQRITPLVVTRRLDAVTAQAEEAFVITARDIELRQAVFAAQMLAIVPGASVSANGAFGGVTSVRLRGASSDKTLVLIDGVPQNDASQPSGGYDFAGLDLADIARIEVLQGPQGALWGSDAIGGVISLVSREDPGLRAGLEGGSFATARGHVRAAGVGGAWFAALSLSGYRSDGVSKADGFPEADGLRTWTASGAARVSPTDFLQLDGRLRYTDTEVDIDGYAPPLFAFGDTAEVSRAKAWTGFGRARIEGPAEIKTALMFDATRLERAITGGAFPSSFRADRRDWRWTSERRFDRWSLTVGAERDETKATLSDGSRERLTNNAAFALLSIEPADFIRLDGSLRRDDPSGFAGKTTGHAGATLRLGRDVSLIGNVGQGFKTATISQVACDFCFPPGPSVGLKPERSEGWDVGLLWRPYGAIVLARVTVFGLDVRDQISFGTGRYVNLERTRSRGVEASLEARPLASLTLTATYAYVDAEDRSTGEQLLRVPRHSGSASLSWDPGRYSLTLSLRAESSQADSDPSTFAPARRRGFVTADLAGAYRLTDAVELTARIENLADRRYQDALGYGEPGRALYVGVRVSR